jgi:hypothetical protein
MLNVFIIMEEKTYYHCFHLLSELWCHGTYPKFHVSIKRKDFDLKKGSILKDLGDYKM